MEITLQKTFTFILFIGIGLLLKLKFDGKNEISGIKKIILNLALPATIFIALLGIKIDASLLLLPVMALALNGILFFGFPLLLPLLGIYRNSPKYRTAKMLIPSLAPGLSCFPFILEYLGDGYLAKAAMADLGNKVFVLMILYLVAMNWHYKLQSQVVRSQASKLKSLFIAMISEPVNLFIAAALILLGFGLNIDSLPFVISDTLLRLSTLMTPLVLLFIGLAVKIRRKQFTQILSILLLRAGVVVLACTAFVYIFNVSVQNDILLMLAFGLSACSFWPFAHISAVGSQEEDLADGQKTFDGTFSINILALSFPLSTALILGVLSSGNTFYGILPLLILSGVLLFLGFIPVIFLKAQEFRLESARENKEVAQYEASSATEGA
ncbi:permease [Leeuwenhoekiella sp. A16]|uniref:permease n=1 Tax=unclassified Leeuwenhoekiella TaxID=2615029 RepID=UPI003A80C1D9